MNPSFTSSSNSFPSSANSKMLLDATRETPFALSLLAKNSLQSIENRFIVFIDDFISGLGEAMSDVIDPMRDRSHP